MQSNSWWLYYYGLQGSGDSATAPKWLVVFAYVACYAVIAVVGAIALQCYLDSADITQDTERRIKSAYLMAVVIGAIILCMVVK